MKRVSKKIRSAGKQAVNTFSKLTSPDPNQILENIGEQAIKEQPYEAAKLGQLVESRVEELVGKKFKKNYGGNVEDVEYEEIEEKEEVDQKAQEELEARKKLDEEQLRLAKKEEQLTQEQKKQVEDARKGKVPAYTSGMVPGGPMGGMSITQNNDAAIDAAQQQQDLEEQKTSIKESAQEKIQKVNEWLAKKKEYIKSGPHGLFAFFSSNLLFWTLAIIDSLVGMFGGPVTGDILMFVVLAMIWAIPCILLFNVTALFRILLFLGIDAAFGATFGTASNAILPVAGEGIVDIIPEVILSFRHSTAADVLKKVYQEKIPALISQAVQISKAKITAINDETRFLIKNAVLGLRGRFSGVAIEGRKTIFVALAILITAGVQYFGWFGFAEGQLVLTLAFLVLLLGAKFVGFLGYREFIGLALLMLLNIGFTYILQADSWLAQWIGSGNALVATILFLLFSVLLIFHIAKPESMSSSRLTGIMLIVVLLFSFPYLGGYVTSEQFTQDIERQQVETQAELDTFNFWERAINWYTEMQARGSGTYIPSADQERVHEFIGVSMSSIETSRDEFVEGQPVQFNVQYETGSKEEIMVLTTCDTKGIQGNVTPNEPVPATELYTPIVRCVFEGLPKGSQLITINAFYNYESRIEIPLYFMTQIQQAAILDRGGEPETFIGDIPKPRTSSGPVDFGVSNRLGDNPEFELPLVYDTDDPNRFPQTVFLTLRNPTGSKVTQGDLRSISKIQFDLPEGLHIGNCDFMLPQTGRLETTARDNGRWIVDVTDRFDTFRLNDVISCDLFIDEAYVDTYLPATGYSLSTMYFNIDYTYGLTQTTPVTVT